MPCYQFWTVLGPDLPRIFWGNTEKELYSLKKLCLGLGGVEAGKGKGTRQGPEVPGNSPYPGLPKAGVPRILPRSEQGQQSLQGSVGGALQAREGRASRGVSTGSLLWHCSGEQELQGKEGCEYWDRHGAAMGMVKAEMETGPHISSGC